MSEASVLLTEAEKLARVADAVSAAYATELARVLRDLERELRTLAVAAKAGKQGPLARAVRAAKARRQIRQALKAAGYERLATDAATVGLDRIVAAVERLRGAAALAAFATVDQTRILALKELAKLDILGQGDEIAHALWRTLARGLFAQVPTDALLTDLADAIDTELYEARTLYDTTVNVFGRQIEAMQTTEDDLFVYMGPADAKLRPFCYARVGKVFTKAQIDAMENGQLANVFLTGGGYNCRHSWVALSLASELRVLVNTNERVPEIERLLLVQGGTKAA